MDDGLGGSFTEVNTANDPAVRNIPYLNQFAITAFPASSIGHNFRIYLTAFNSEGNVNSGIVTIQLASVPTTPVNPVHEDLLNSDQDQLSVYMDPIVSPNDGGSTILSYSLEIDDGMNGDFIVLTGMNSLNSLKLYVTLYSP